MSAGWCALFRGGRFSNFNGAIRQFIMLSWVSALLVGLFIADSRMCEDCHFSRQILRYVKFCNECWTLRQLAKFIVAFEIAHSQVFMTGSFVVRRVFLNILHRTHESVYKTIAFFRNSLALFYGIFEKFGTYSDKCWYSRMSFETLTLVGYPEWLYQKDTLGMVRKSQWSWKGLKVCTSKKHP